MTRMIAERPAVRAAGSEEKTSRLQATACENVAASLNRESFTVESAAIQVLNTRLTKAGNYFCTRKAGYNTNALRVL